MFVCKDEKETVLHFSVAENAMEFLTGFIDSLTVARVDNEDETLGAGVVMSPERSNFVLASYVPDVEFNLTGSNER